MRISKIGSCQGHPELLNSSFGVQFHNNFNDNWHANLTHQILPQIMICHFTWSNDDVCKYYVQKSWSVTDWHQCLFRHVSRINRGHSTFKFSFTFLVQNKKRDIVGCAKSGKWLHFYLLRQHLDELCDEIVSFRGQCFLTISLSCFHPSFSI